MEAEAVFISLVLLYGGIIYAMWKFVNGKKRKKRRWGENP